MSSANKLNFMTSHYVMVTNKLYLDARNNDYIVRCKLGSRTISGCCVTGVRPPEPPPVQGSKKEPGLNRVKRDGQGFSRNIGMITLSVEITFLL